MERDSVKIFTAKVAPVTPSHTVNDTDDIELQPTFWLSIGRFILTVTVTTSLWSCSTYTASVAVQKGSNPVLLAWLCLVAFTIAPGLCCIIMWGCGEQSGSWRTLGPYSVTAALVIKRIFPICSLSLLALSLYFLALPRLCTLEVVVLYSCKKAFCYLLSWTVLREQFIGARVVGVIFCMTGVVMMSYTESPEEDASSGRMLSLTAAALTALNEVLTRILIGKLNYQETVNFMGLCGICSALLLWWAPLMLLLHQKIEEPESLIYPTIEYLFATILFFFLYHILEKIGCLFLPSSGVSLGVFLSAAFISGMDNQWGISYERYMMGFLAIGVGFILLIIPEDWRSYLSLAPKEQCHQDEISDETKSKGSLSAI